MKRLFVSAICFALACAAFPASAQVAPVQMPLPTNLRLALEAKTPAGMLAAFFGTPFREDGAIDEHGNYTLFSQPGKTFKEPGLNCSGYVLAASRLLFGKNIPLADAAKDRLGDSGKGAEMGQDWDFGWDLILNVTEGQERTLLLPGGKAADPAAGSGMEPLGFELHSPKTWEELPSRIRAGHLYFVSINRPTKQRGYSLLHYHVGMILRTSENDWHLYHSIKKHGAVRENLGDGQARARFLEKNVNIGGAPKRIFILEVPLAPRF